MSLKYSHILRYVAGTPWAILPSKLSEILAVLAFRSAGGEFTAEEIQARIGAGPTTPAASKRGGIAVLPLRGTIAHRVGSMDESSGGMSVERFMAMYRAVLADDSIGTIVLDVDSPGGTVAGVPEAADELLAARGQKRVVAVANATMASAAYWLAAAAADEIVATPSATVGSIGALAVHEDFSQHLAKEGVAVSVIKAGKYKAEGSPFEPLSEEARAVLQARVDEAYTSFVKAVAKGRGVTPAAVRAGYGEGRALSAADAKAAGLVDRVATLDETLARLAGRPRSGAAGTRAAADDPELVADDAGTPPPVVEVDDVDLRAWGLRLR